MTASMTSKRIEELLTPFVGASVVSNQQLGAISAYLDILLKWNAKLNLTSIRNLEEIIVRHFGESLFAASKVFPSRPSNQTVIDVGSGAGFPGLPIKLWDSSLKVTLIESNHRKATFLREVIRALGLTGIEVLSIRAEDVSVRASLVTLRAVEKFEHVLPIARGLTNPGGRIALLVGEGQVHLATSLLPDVSWESPIFIPNSRNRVLLVGTN